MGPESGSRDPGAKRPRRPSPLRRRAPFSDDAFPGRRSGQQGIPVLQDLRAGGAGGAEAPLAAVRLDLAALREHRLGLFRAEMRFGGGRSEESEHVVDRADVVLEFIQEGFRGGFLPGGPDESI